MRIVILVFVALSACEAPAPNQMRVNGDGFSLVLAPGWEVQGVDGDRRFSATKEGRGSLDIIELRDVDPDILVNEERCRAWTERVANGIGGRVNRSMTKNGRCTAAVEVQRFRYHIESFSTPVGLFGFSCTADVQRDCATMVASWREEPSAVAKRMDDDIAVTTDRATQVIHGHGFTLTLPDHWKATERIEPMLVQAESTSGVMIAIAISQPWNVGNSAACVSSGKSFAAGARGVFVGASIVKTSVGLACRIDMKGTRFAYVLYVSAPDRQTYFVGCGTVNGEVVVGACDPIIDNWRFE